jgi:hypothetical protein
MMNYCKKKSDEINLNNIDCICNQNLNICFLKKQRTNNENEIYNYLEYTIIPKGRRLFLRI